MGGLNSRKARSHQTELAMASRAGSPRQELSGSPVSVSDINTGRPRFIALLFIGLHRCCIFYKLKARPSPSKMIPTSFIAIPALSLVVWNQPHSISEVRLCLSPHQARERRVLPLLRPALPGPRAPGLQTTSSCSPDSAPRGRPCLCG